MKRYKGVSVLLAGLLAVSTGVIEVHADKLSNNGEEISNPYGDSGLPSSFTTGEYYDCAVPYGMTIEEIGGYANGVTYDPYGYGAMPAGREKNIPGYWFNYEGDFIGSGSFSNLSSRVLGSKGVSSYESDTGASIVTVNDVDFYVTAVQPFFYNCDKADKDGFAGCTELDQFNIDPVGHLIDVIFTDGTCLHYICGDINSINHTNGGPAENPPREVVWTFTDMKCPQYKNLFSAAGGNTLEVWGQNGCSSKLAEKYNLGSEADKNHIAYYRMYNLSVNDDFEASSDEAKSVSYNVGDIDASAVKKKNKDVNTASDGEEIRILKQWELPGMPRESVLTADVALPELVDRSNLTAVELNTVTQVKDDIKLRNSFNVWTDVRVAFVFFGLLLIVYSFIMVLALLFDMVNNFFNFSLVNFITLGSVHYSRAIETPLEEGRYVGAKRVVVTICVLFAVGCLLVSGGVLPPLLRLIYRVYSKFMV